MMSQFSAIIVPQSGPNDVTATLVEWAKAAGQWVNRGEVVAVAETTKSVFEIEAPHAGYLHVLAESGQEVAVGAIIAVLGQAPVSGDAGLGDAVQAWLAQQRRTPQQPDETVASPHNPDLARPATKKAEVLAQRHQIDLAQVPASGERISEADVLAYLAGARDGRGVISHLPSATTTPQQTAAALRDLVDSGYRTNRVQRLLIVGGGNGAVQIIDALTRIPLQRAAAIMDDNTALHGRSVAGVPVIGAIALDRAAEMVASGEIDAAVISVSTSIPFRERIFTAWKAQGIPFTNVIHPSATIGMNVAMGEGNVVMAFCHFGACATVGDNNFLSAYCSIEHHCVLASHCSFGPGVVTSSRVQIGERVRFGTGIFIEPGVTIGADSIIASGLAIGQNVPARSLLKAKIGYSIRERP
jgi:sugar O-acyltransferase (sialic acid O-acetyltransferase NeuD family)